MADDRQEILQPHRYASVHETQVADAPLDLYLFPKVLLETNTNLDAVYALLSLDISTFPSRRFRAGGVISTLPISPSRVLKPVPRIVRRSIRFIVEIHFYFSAECAIRSVFCARSGLFVACPSVRKLSVDVC